MAHQVRSCKQQASTYQQYDDRFEAEAMYTKRIRPPITCTHTYVMYSDGCLALSTTKGCQAEAVLAHATLANRRTPCTLHTISQPCLKPTQQHSKPGNSQTLHACLLQLNDCAGLTAATLNTCERTVGTLDQTQPLHLAVKQEVVGVHIARCSVFYTV
jgi:hypothetical protein